MTAYEPKNCKHDDLDAYINDLTAQQVPDGPGTEVNSALCQRISQIHTHDVRLNPTWKIKIMKTTRIAAVFIIIASLIAGIVINLGSSTPAFAKIRENILSARSMSCMTTIEFDNPQPNQPETLEMKMIILNPGWMRQEMSVTDPKTNKQQKIVNIINFAEQKMLSLVTNEKTAMLIDMAGIPEEQLPKDIVSEFAKLGDQDGKLVGREKLNGRETLLYEVTLRTDDALAGIGFREDMNLKIWIDEQSEKPIKMLMALPEPMNMTMTMDQFTWDGPIDSTQFSLDIPKDYKTQTLDISHVTEEDLADSLKVWTELNGGKFPDTYDQIAMQELLTNLDNKDESTPDEKMLNYAQKLTRGLMFSTQQIGKFHYLGKSKTTVDTDQIICYWEDEKSRKHRAIFGDFSIKEVPKSDLPQ